MSRRSKEKLRATRRDAYRQKKLSLEVREQPIRGYVNGDTRYPYTREQEREWRRTNNLIIAHHEASHAVAAWMMGMPIGEMKMNDPRHELVAQIETGIPVNEMLIKPLGERLVHAFEHAFVTLAGVCGSGEVNSDNPFCKLQVVMHMAETVGKLMTIGNLTEHEAYKEAERIMAAVCQAFDDPRVTSTAQWLAGNFQRLRTMSGEQVTGCIAQAYPQFDRAFRERTEAAKNSSGEAQRPHAGLVNHSHPLSEELSHLSPHLGNQAAISDGRGYEAGYHG